MDPKYNVWMFLALGALIDSMVATIKRYCDLKSDSMFIDSFAEKAKPLVRLGTITLVKVDKNAHQWMSPDGYEQYLDSQGLRPLDAYELLCLLYQRTILTEELLVVSEKPGQEIFWYAHLAHLVEFISEDTMRDISVPCPISFICAVK